MWSFLLGFIVGIVLMALSIVIMVFLYSNEPVRCRKCGKKVSYSHSDIMHYQLQPSSDESAEYIICTGCGEMIFLND